MPLSQWCLAAVAAWLMGMSKSGFAAGLGAFATPLLALLMPLPQAAALLLPLLLLLDLASVYSWRRQLDWTLLRGWLPPGVLGVVLGYLLFARLSAAQAGLLVGVLTLLLLPLSAGGPGRRQLGSHGWGQAMAALSGFASLLCHAGGPPITLHGLARGLPPTQLAAACTLFFAVLNLLKWPLYASLGLLAPASLAQAWPLLLPGLLGVACGVYGSARLSARCFYRWSCLALSLAAGKLIMDGLMAAGRA